MMAGILQNKNLHGSWGPSGCTEHIIYGNFSKKNKNKQTNKQFSYFSMLDYQNIFPLFHD